MSPGTNPRGRHGVMLPIVLMVLLFLVLLAFVLLSSSQEGYNQVSVAVMGRRADMLARAAVDEARDNLAAWLARIPGRVPPGGEDLFRELLKNIEREVPADWNQPVVSAGDIWNADLGAFYRNHSLIRRSAGAIGDGGFVITEARVRLHGFYKIDTRLSDPRGDIPYYSYPGGLGAEDMKEDPPPQIIDYAGYATFRVSLKSAFGRMPIERCYSATHDLKVVETAPLAGQFALMQYLATPDAQQFYDAMRTQGADIREQPTHVWSDLNSGGAFRVYPSGGRVMVNGPYVIDSTGWPEGIAPFVRFQPLEADFGPGVRTAYHWVPYSFTGFGGTPAPRAGVMEKLGFFLGIRPKNARPRVRGVLWLKVAEGLQAIEDDAGKKLAKPQHWFSEYRHTDDSDHPESRGFSLFGDPRRSRFSAYRGPLVRFGDEGGAPERYGLIPPAPDASRRPNRAWVHPKLEREYACLDITNLTLFSGSLLDYLPSYNGRRFAVLPEGKLYMRARWGEFKEPRWLTNTKLLVALLSSLAIYFSATELSGTARNVCIGLSLGITALVLLYDGYVMGNDCEEAVPTVPVDSGDQFQNFLNAIPAAIATFEDWEEAQKCLDGLINSKTKLPKEALHLYGAHWQPFVSSDPRAELAQALLQTTMFILSVGMFAGLGYAGVVAWQALLVSGTFLVAGSLILGDSLTPHPPGAAVAVSPEVGAAYPPRFRNLLLAAGRHHETLEDALQPVPGHAFKLLVLSGPMYVRKLWNTSPFFYAGRGIIYSDDKADKGELPLLTGPIVPVGHYPLLGVIPGAEPWAYPGSSSLSIIHWPSWTDRSLADLAQGAALVRLSGADPAGGAIPLTEGTTAFFKVSLLAHGGAVPDPGGGRGRKTRRAVILGNYMCGLINKARIEPDSQLEVWYDPELAKVTSCHVGVVSPRAIAVHH